MSNEHSDIINQIKELNENDLNISKNVSKIKKSIRHIEEKISNIEDTVNRMFDILNTISVFIEEAEEQGDLDSDEEAEESWNPYGIQPGYEEYYDEEEDEWNNREDES